MLRLGDVIALGGKKATDVVVFVNDCSAKVVKLNSRDWNDPQAQFNSNEYGVYISPNSEVQIVGRVPTSRIATRESAYFERTDASKPREAVFVPIPGWNTPKKRSRRRPKVDVVADGEQEDSNLAPPGEDNPGQTEANESHD